MHMTNHERDVAAIHNDNTRNYVLCEKLILNAICYNDGFGLFQISTKYLTGSAVNDDSEGHAHFDSFLSDCMSMGRRPINYNRRPTAINTIRTN
jgi:hypothetical protein